MVGKKQEWFEIATRAGEGYPGVSLLSGGPQTSAISKKYYIRRISV
jgi:hypothetical protein